ECIEPVPVLCVLYSPLLKIVSFLSLVQIPLLSEHLIVSLFLSGLQLFKLYFCLFGIDGGQFRSLFPHFCFRLKHSHNLLAASGEEKTGRVESGFWGLLDSAVYGLPSRFHTDPE